MVLLSVEELSPYAITPHLLILHRLYSSVGFDAQVLCVFNRIGPCACGVSPYIFQLCCFASERAPTVYIIYHIKILVAIILHLIISIYIYCKKKKGFQFFQYMSSTKTRSTSHLPIIYMSVNYFLVVSDSMKSFFYPTLIRGIG